MRRLFIILLLSMFLVTGVMAETYKVNTPTDLKFTCTLNYAIPSASTTYNITISSISDGSILVNNKAATPRGQGAFNYTVTFPAIGEYKIEQFCYDGSYSYSNEEIVSVTPTGNERINSGEGLNIIGSIIVLIIVAGFFFILGIGMESMAGKVIFSGLAAIILIITVLFTLLSLTQTLGSFTDLIEGYSTFWFIVKILIGIGILMLLVIAMLLGYNSWMKKRGFRD